MGLGGVAIATLPSVIFPKLMFSDRLGGKIVAKYAKTIGFGKIIFAFLMLNTMSSAHNKIFGAKFLSFERLDTILLYTVSYAVLLRIVMKSDSQKSHFLLQ